jgi:hypothetical protein
MSRRAVVIMLTAVIAVAIAIPALANTGTTAKSASVKGLSVRALGKAKAALRTARSAKRDIHKAVTAATASQSSATTAQAAATTAKAEAAKGFEKAASAREVAGGAELKAKETNEAFALTRPQIGFAEGEVTSESLSFQKLSGGPSVTVTVPQTGLVQVWAQALIEGEGAVSLYEGNQQVEGQATDCNGAKGVLFAVESPGEPTLAATPAAFDIAGACATLGAPGPVLFRTTGGAHTFELRYAACSCEPGPDKASFSQRRLVVQALP